jgi:hypothetical protein
MVLQNVPLAHAYARKTVACLEPCLSFYGLLGSLRLYEY